MYWSPERTVFIVIIAKFSHNDSLDLVLVLSDRSHTIVTVELSGRDTM